MFNVRKGLPIGPVEEEAPAEEVWRAVMGSEFRVAPGARDRGREREAAVGRREDAVRVEGGAEVHMSGLGEAEGELAAKARWAEARDERQRLPNLAPGCGLDSEAETGRVAMGAKDASGVV